MVSCTQHMTVASNNSNSSRKNIKAANKQLTVLAITAINDNSNINNNSNSSNDNKKVKLRTHESWAHNPNYLIY